MIEFRTKIKVDHLADLSHLVGNHLPNAFIYGEDIVDPSVKTLFDIDEVLTDEEMQTLQSMAEENP